MLNYHGGSHPTNLQTVMSSTAINMTEQPPPLILEYNTHTVFKYSLLIFEMGTDRKRWLIKKKCLKCECDRTLR